MRGARGAGALLALVVIAGLWAALAVQVSGDRLHRAPLLLVGPDVVTAALADEAAQLDGPPLEIGATESLDDAREALRRGDAVAVVDIDLATSRDRLLLGRELAPERDAAVIAAVQSVEQARERTLEVVEPADRMRGATPVELAALLVLAGFVLVVAVSAIWGSWARTWPRALSRLAGLVAWGAAIGVVVAAVAAPPGGAGDGPGWGLRLGLLVLATLSVVAAGLLTLACEALVGARGLLVAAALLLALPLPLVVTGDVALLAEPFATIAAWTPLGGVAEAVSEVGAGRTDGLVRPAVVVIGTVLLAGGLLIAVRAWARRRGAAGEAAPVEPHLPAPLPRGERQQLAVLAGVLIVATVVVIGAWSRTDQQSLRQPLASLASTSSCTSTGEVASVDDLNRIAELRGTAEFQGGDVGASATLSDGRTLWVFGDTLRGDGAESADFVRNSLLLIDSECVRAVVPRSGGAIIPDRADGVGYWPMALTVVERNGYDLVTVTAQRVRTVDADDPFGFEALGPAAAVLLVPDGEVPQLISRTDLGPDDTATTSPMWGAATAEDGRWLYLYGTSRPEDPEPGTGFALRVARVEPERLGETDRWRYWDGADWSRDPAAALELIGSTPGVSQTLSVFERDGTWYAFSKRGEVLGEDLVFWTAPGPQGPFTATEPVAQLPSLAGDGEDGLLRYMPLAHPDLLPAPGSVVVSYSRNTTEPGAVIADPLLYRPRFLRVDLPAPGRR